MAPLNKMIDLDISQASVNESDLNQDRGMKEPQHRDMAVFKRLEDYEDVPAATKPTMCSGALSFQDYIEFLVDANAVPAREKEWSTDLLEHQPFDLDCLLEDFLVGSEHHDPEPTKKSCSKSSQHKLDEAPSIHMCIQTRRLNNMLDNVDGSSMRIASKAHKEPSSKKVQKGKRGRRPISRSSAPDLRAKSMAAKSTSKHAGSHNSSFSTLQEAKSSSLVSRDEMQAAIREALIGVRQSTSPAEKKFATQDELPPAMIDESPGQPTKKKPASKKISTPDRLIADSKVLAKILHASSGSTLSRIIRSNFQKTMDESDLNVDSADIQKAKVEEQQASMKKELREKEETIKALSRQLEEARKLNQQKEMEIIRRKAVDKTRRPSRPVKPVARRNAVPRRVIQHSELTPDSARRSTKPRIGVVDRHSELSLPNTKSRKQTASEGSAESIVRRKKAKAARTKDPLQCVSVDATDMQEETSMSRPCQKVKNNRVSETSTKRKSRRSTSSNASKGQTVPRRSTSHRGGKTSKGHTDLKVKRSTSEGSILKKGTEY